MAKDSIVKKSPRKMSPYNLFMKTELGKVKESTPGISHKDAFKLAAQNWGKSAENPKNKKEAVTTVTEEKK